MRIYMKGRYPQVKALLKKTQLFTTDPATGLIRPTHEGIAHNAKAINEDSTNLYYGDDFLFLKCKTQEEAADIICTQFCDLVKKFGIEKVQILSPFRAEGLAAVEQLNRTIRELVNPPEDEDIPDLKMCVVRAIAIGFILRCSTSTQ